MIVAALLVHLPNGFFMNWFGTEKGEGIEYHLLVLAISVVIIAQGSGAWSVDRLLMPKLEEPVLNRSDHTDGAAGTGVASTSGRRNTPYIVRSWGLIAAQYRRRF